jgi:hypothetical protein
MTHLNWQTVPGTTTLVSSAKMLLKLKERSFRCSDVELKHSSIHPRALLTPAFVMLDEMVPFNALHCRSNTPGSKYCESEAYSRCITTASSGWHATPGAVRWVAGSSQALHAPSPDVGDGVAGMVCVTLAVTAEEGLICEDTDGDSVAKLLAVYDSLEVDVAAGETVIVAEAVSEAVAAAEMDPEGVKDGVVKEEGDGDGLTVLAWVRVKELDAVCVRLDELVLVCEMLDEGEPVCVRVAEGVPVCVRLVEGDAV